MLLTGVDLHGRNTKLYTHRFAELNHRIRENHQQLVERLDTPKPKLVLRIIDAKDIIAGELSLGSFICGFRLTWQIMNQIQSYGGNSSDPEVDEARHSLCKDENGNAKMLEELFGGYHLNSHF